MNKNILEQIVSDIVQEADELKSKKKNDYEEGQLLAFASVLDIIKSACAGYDLKEIGLDFDVDERYLIGR